LEKIKNMTFFIHRIIHYFQENTISIIHKKGDVIMDRNRATQIATSPEMANVTYDGRPIYIEKVSSTNDTASIHFLNQPHYSQEVNLTQLIETK
jgi:small acid-soluble spore protein H (minor)